VIRLEPAQHAALARLAGIDGRAGRVAASQAGYRAAGVAARAAQSPAAALYEAHAELAAGRTAAAEAHMREAIAANPANAEALVVLGRVLLESGRADEAAASLEAALEVNPELDDGWGLLTGSRRFVEADRPKLALMETNLQRPQLYNGARLALHFALGKAYDDLGDYAVAIRHFDAANALRGAGRRLDRDWLERQTSDLIAATPPGFHEPSLGVGDATPILIVGMPRSGTTLVEQILSSHRRVAAGGELAFWRDNSAGRALLTGAQARRQAASLAGDYLATLRAISAEAGRVTDKMPSNFWRLGLIRQVFPRAAIVHCRRDPRDTCLSNYMTHFAAVDDYVSDRGDLAFYFRQYRRLMAHWREAMPAEGFVEVDYEALVADPETTTRWLVAACGLEWDDACLEPERNPRRITTASVWQARQPIYRASVERWRHYEPWLGELHTLAANAEPSS
jgi:tetratricopeptide (TPR) repeat protein